MSGIAELAAKLALIGAGFGVLALTGIASIAVMLTIWRRDNARRRRRSAVILPFETRRR